MLAETLVKLLTKKVLSVSSQMESSTSFQSSTVELESRLYSNHNKYEVSPGHWENLSVALKEMNKRSEITEIVSVSVDGYSDRIRLTYHEDGNVSIEKEAKYKLNPIDVDLGHWTRYSISVERPITNLDEGATEDMLEEQKQELILKRKSLSRERVIKRTRYWIRNYIVVDMSVATEDEKQNLEIEVELIDAHKNIDRIPEFITISRKVMALMRGTTYLYNSTIIETLSTMVNMQLPAKSSTENIESEVYRYNIDRAIFNNVRTIKKEDVVLGGIIGSGIRNISYSVCHKTDGQRSFLIFSPLGVWICWPPLIYNLIDPTLSITDSLSIFDGEMIPREQREDKSGPRFVFEIFDALMVESKDIRQLDHEQRLRTCSAFFYSVEKSNVMPSNLEVTFKKMYTITSPEQFFYTVKMLLDSASEYRYSTDGLLFTPYNYHYWTGVDINNADKKRNLTTTPEIVKWKSQELTTIDFRYSIVDGYDTLMVAEVEGEETKEYPFRGTLRYPFDQRTMIDWEQVKDRGLMIGAIGEFSWNGSKYVFRNLRNDKQYPNTGTTVAEHNWEEVNSPLTAEAITGENFQFMFFEHNRIKSEMLSYGSRSILDIGAGRGGIIWRLRNFDVVIAVEPNASHREEYVKRATMAGYLVIGPDDPIPRPIKIDGVEKVQKFVVLIEGKAEDTDKIKEQVFRVTPNGVNTVSLIDVATFLWKDKETLTKSMNTVKECLAPGGVFLWKMMSGDRVRRLISPQHCRDAVKGNGELSYGNFKLKYRVIKDDVDKKVKIYIPEGITTEGDAEEGWQEEWLTSPDEMIKNYFSEGYKETLRKVADAEYFMNQNSRKLSKLYEYGVVKKDGVDIQKDRFAPKAGIKSTSTVRRVRRVANK